MNNLLLVLMIVSYLLWLMILVVTAVLKDLTARQWAILAVLTPFAPLLIALSIIGAIVVALVLDEWVTDWL